jgi:glycosyltransferase involved in cell wall biosynthesis
LRRYLKISLITKEIGDQKKYPKCKEINDEIPFEILTRKGWGDLWQKRHSSPLKESEFILLQYVPQLYFPRRDLLWLLIWLYFARFHQRKKIILTVHEYNVPLTFSIKRVTARVILDLLFVLLAFLAKKIVVTHGLNYKKLQSFLFWQRHRLMQIPVGSNIPHYKPGGVINGVDADRLPILTLFGQPKAMDKGLLKVLGEVAKANQHKIRIRWIGRTRSEILAVWQQECGIEENLLEIYQGESAEAVSGLLQEGYIFLAPFCDGVSSRRTTVMAALEHGLPIVGTKGICTDSIFCEAPSVLLNEPKDKQAFKDNLESLISNQWRVETMRQSARDMFVHHFSWEVIAGKYWQLLKH